MKTLTLLLAAICSLPALAAPQNLERCRGSFIISTESGSQLLVEEFLAGSARSNILLAKELSSRAPKIFQAQAASRSAVAPATVVMQVLAQLEGVVVECDSALGQ